MKPKWSLVGKWFVQNGTGTTIANMGDAEASQVAQEKLRNPGGVHSRRTIVTRLILNNRRGRHSSSTTTGTAAETSADV